ncbi:MAG: phage holin family protein [Clostridia bacterium]
MEEFLNIACAPIICLFVYYAMDILKLLTKQNEMVKRFIPLIAGFLGAILGMAAFYIAPSIILTDNIVMAMIIGCASGLSATGANQIIKQLHK